MRFTAVDGAPRASDRITMALGSTVRRFNIELADVDRGVYETLDLRVAQHPSEGVDRLAVRVFARCLAHDANLEFGRGLSTVEEPALWHRDSTGQIRLWVDVGSPSANRLHRASKSSKRVVVVTHKSNAGLQKEWSSRAIHKADTIEVIRLGGSFVDDVSARIDRQNQWVFTLSEGCLSLGIGEESLATELEYTTVQMVIG